MAIRRKRLSVRRDHQLILKVTDDEYAILSKLADDAGLSLATYIVACSLGNVQLSDGTVFYYPGSLK